MSNFSNDGLQVAEYLYDFAEDGGVDDTAIVLSDKAGKEPIPLNAIIKSVSLRVITAVVGTSSTLIVGNTTDPNGYMEAIGEATLVADFVTAEGVQNGVLLWDDTNDHRIPFLVNSANDEKFEVLIGTADLTAGKVAFFVEYYLGSVNT